MNPDKKNSLPVGTELGPFTYTITEEMAELYLEANDNRDPLYEKTDATQRRMIPSCFTLQNYVYLLAQKSAWGLGGVHTAQDSEYFHPCYVGDEIINWGKIVDRYQKKDRDYFVMEYWTETRDGTLLARHKITGITF